MESPAFLTKALRKLFGLRMDTSVHDWDESDIIKSLNLIEDEMREVTDAAIELSYHLHPYSGVTVEHVANFLEELADIIIVTYDQAAKLGLPLDEAIQAKMAANLTKLDDNGQPIIDPTMGKYLKGPNYKPADIEAIVRKRFPEFLH